MPYWMPSYGSAMVPDPSSPGVAFVSASSFPKSLETLWGTAEKIAAYVGEATDGNS